MLLVPVTLIVGITTTFKVAGPLHRLEQHCRAIIRGEDPGICKLRKGDEMQDLCDLFNQAIDKLREKEGQEESYEDKQAA